MEDCLHTHSPGASPAAEWEESLSDGIVSHFRGLFSVERFKHGEYGCVCVCSKVTWDCWLAAISFLKYCYKARLMVEYLIWLNWVSPKALLHDKDFTQRRHCFSAAGSKGRLSLVVHPCVKNNSIQSPRFTKYVWMQEVNQITDPQQVNMGLTVTLLLCV